MPRIDLLLMIAGAILPAASVASANCPAVGEVLLTEREEASSLPAFAAPVAMGEPLQLGSDACIDAAPPATVVTAKLMIENYAEIPQAVECTLASSKTSDVAEIRLPPGQIGTVTLQIANPAGGGGTTPNLTNLTCRNLVPSAADSVTAALMKITTRAVKSVTIVEAR